MQDRASAPSVPAIQLFRDIFDASPVGIAVENLDGQPLFVNPALCSILGFSEDELRRKHCVDFSPPEDAQKDWALFQQLRAGSIDHYQLEKRYFRRDGSLVWGSLSISLLNSRASSLVLAMVQDITEKKTAEVARIRHAAIVEASEDAIASGTLDGIIVSWNTGAQHMYGYTEAEAMGREISILVPPELADEENEILKRLKAGGRIEQFETIRVANTGKRINVSLSISPIKDSTGAIVGVCGIARDITDRKRAEEALRESEERLRLAVQAGKTFAYSWDAATDVIERSGESAAILGVKNEQAATGAAISAMVHPDDKQRLDAALASVKVENPTLQITYRIICPDGAVKWLERNSRAYFDAQGKLKRIVGMIADVTERKQAEETRFRHAAIVESSEDAIISKNLDGVITSWNTAAHKIFEYTEAEAIGRPIGIIIPPNLFDEEQKIIERLRTGERIEHYETVRITKTGKKVNISLTVSPVKDSTGRLVGFSKIARDITERKLADDALAEVSRALVEIQERERTRIARDLHDDIQQQIALAAVDVKALQQNLPNSAVEMNLRLTEVWERLTRISTAVQSISRQLHSPQLEYLGVVAAIRSFCKEFAARQNVEIDFKNDDVPKDVPHEISLCMFRIVQEALHNAAKHSQVRTFEVKLNCSANQLHLTVSDRGAGFDAEASMNKQGLGLISMRERVRLVNGTILIESRPMGGTTIHVCVPLESDQAQRAAG